MADTTLTDILIALNAVRTETEAMRNEMRNSFVAARTDTEALRRDMEGNTASILSDVAKQLAPMMRAIEQLRDQNFVDYNRTQRLERMAEGQGDLAQAIAGLVRQVSNLADRVLALEQGRG